MSCKRCDTVQRAASNHARFARRRTQTKAAREAPGGTRRGRTRRGSYRFRQQRLGERTTIERDWRGAVSASVLLVVVEVESDGSACDAARKLVRALRRSPSEVLGGKMGGKAIGVLVLARSLCAFSSASGGAQVGGLPTKHVHVGRALRC
jgi:hypothetical protein